MSLFQKDPYFFTILLLVVISQNQLFTSNNMYYISLCNYGNYNDTHSANNLNMI